MKIGDDKGKRIMGNLLGSSVRTAFLSHPFNRLSNMGSTPRCKLPEGFEELRPGPQLAALVWSLNPKSLSPSDRVRLLQANQKLVSHFQARAYADMAAIWEFEERTNSSGDPADDFRFAVQEIRAALRLSRRAAEVELSNAIDYWQRLPRVGDELSLGWIDIRRARVIAQETGHLPEGTARNVVEQTVWEARRLTAGQLGAFLRRYIVKDDPESAQLRYEESLAERRLAVEAEPEGTASVFGLHLSPDRVEAAMAFINDLATSLRGEGDMRSLDQIRADVFLDLLAGHPLDSTSNRRGSVDLLVDLATLAGLSEAPGELGGYGPIIADISRRVAEAQELAEWRYRVTDPENGTVVAEGTTRRRPSRKLRRTVEGRDPRCVFPGCRVPARRCDFDHTRPWAIAKETIEENGAPICEGDHVVRHAAGWDYERMSDGDYLWTSPFGLRYTTSGRPPP
jgi:hypothetical protein